LVLPRLVSAKSSVTLPASPVFPGTTPAPFPLLLLQWSVPTLLFTLACALSILA
jgi:hypothetical protein